MISQSGKLNRAEAYTVLFLSRGHFRNRASSLQVQELIFITHRVQVDRSTFCIITRDWQIHTLTVESEFQGILTEGNSSWTTRELSVKDTESYQNVGSRYGKLLIPKQAVAFTLIATIVTLGKLYNFSLASSLKQNLTFILSQEL